MIGQFAAGDQDTGAGVGIVLCLREHICRNKIGLRRKTCGTYRPVRNDEHIGGARNKVDTNFTKEEPFRGGHIFVTGTGDNVNTGNGFGADGERGDCLCAADCKNPFRAGKVGGGENSGIREPVITRRGRKDHLCHSGAKSGDHPHKDC
ncbi:hypothetical protein FACS189462_4850 [Spirochaetia bacterium]|nr:hypothetical protein FACS189462_4850 [Spirochaetia bacterium]